MQIFSYENEVISDKLTRHVNENSFYDFRIKHNTFKFKRIHVSA